LQRREKLGGAVTEKARNCAASVTVIWDKNGCRAREKSLKKGWKNASFGLTVTSRDLPFFD